MKKGIGFVLSFIFIFSMTGAAFAGAEADTYEIALMGTKSAAQDHGFQQAAWEGLSAYASAHGKTFATYSPSADNAQAFAEQMTAAVEKGAKVIVLPGHPFAAPAAAIAAANPQVQFLLLDAAPAQEGLSNVYAIRYPEATGGFLAGYAAVKEGYRKLGFLGGMASPAIIRYGYGYVQGAEYAAKEMELADVEVKFWYSASSVASDEIKAQMGAWYAEGTQVVFACGGSVCQSAISAAEEAGGAPKVIGAEYDWAHESDLILTSAIKDVKSDLVLALTKLYAGGGTWGSLGGTVSLDGTVGLPTSTASWRMTTFPVDAYNAFSRQVDLGEIPISAATTPPPAVAYVAVAYLN